MAEFIINGGRKLGGEIDIAGSKNTVFPSIAAAILTEGEVILKKVPAISDAFVMMDVVRDLGGEAEYDQTMSILRIRAKNISKYSVRADLAEKFRGSVLFAGALLGRMKKAELPKPGGDKLGARPLETHFSALSSLGISVTHDETIVFDGEKMKNSVIFMEEPSVTATENAILASVLIEGTTQIRLAACEPHIQELVRFLNKMGARITWKDIGVIEIEGVPKLHGAEFEINPDDLEISGFAVLAAATRSEIFLNGVEYKYLDAILMQLKKMGVQFETRGSGLLIKKNEDEFKSFRVQSGLYPKLMSDHIPPFSVLATQASGTSMIHEWMYEGRLKYIDELAKMGADTKIVDPHRAIITGPKKLYGTSAISYDIRAGLTVVIAALTAEGETKISGIEHIDRGYEYFEERLQKLGADIKRI